MATVEEIRAVPDAAARVRAAVEFLRRGTQALNEVRQIRDTALTELADLPASVVSDQTGITVSYVRLLRWKHRQETECP